MRRMRVGIAQVQAAELLSPLLEGRRPHRRDLRGENVARPQLASFNK